MAAADVIPTTAVATAFATVTPTRVGDEAVIEVLFLHGKPSKADMEAYFASLGHALNEVASPAQPHYVLFDASRLKASDALNLRAFGTAHGQFSKAYKVRTDAVVRGWLVVVKQAALRKLMTWIVSSAGRTAESAPVAAFETIEAAKRGLAEKRIVGDRASTASSSASASADLKPSDLLSAASFLADALDDEDDVEDDE